MTPFRHLQVFIIIIIAQFTCWSGSAVKGRHTMATYRSNVILEFLATTEIEFVERLRSSSYSDLEQRLETMLTEYLEAYRRNTKDLPNFLSVLSVTEKAKISTWNLFSVFQLVRRWIHYITTLQKMLKSVGKAEVTKPLDAHQGLTKRDLNESMLDLLHILHAYNSNISKAADGIIQDIDTGTKLSAEECFEIGNYARDKSYFALSIQFYEEALKRNQIIPTELIENALSATVLEHDRLVEQQALHPYMKQYLFSQTIGPLDKCLGKGKKVSRTYQRTLVATQNPVNFPRIGRRNETFGSGKYEVPVLHDICLHKYVPQFVKEEQANIIEESISLFCWYESTIHPYFSISPLKMELLSTKPELARIYYLLSPARIKAGKEMLRNKSLHEDSVHERHHFIDSVYLDEDMKIFPMEYHILSGFQKWSSRIVRIYRVHSFTPGAKLMPHFDLDSLKDYTAVSILYYLEEPELGGETVFVFPHLKVTPVVGSAIYFVTSLNDGEQDVDSFHTSCPVIIGRKTVLAKIMHLRDREGKCSRHRHEKPKLFPHSKLLNQKLYPKIGKYLRHENDTRRLTDYFKIGF